jgi:predicted phage terminase large subunit-like protein
VNIDLKDILGISTPSEVSPTLETEPRLAPRARGRARRALLRRSFDDFATWAWPLVTGGTYRPNRITSAIIEALQRVGDGEITRLVINCPPGCGKSTCLVLFHAWRLARDPSWRALTASHEENLASTTSRRVRRLITSDEYQRMFPAVALRDDASSIGLWETTANGHFLAVGSSSGVTGRRVNEVVCDDLSAAADRHSKAALDHAWTFFSETLSNRLDNDRASQIVCGQRVAQGDVPGRLIAMGGWTVLSLPAETDDGELLAPDVLPRAKLDAQRALSASTYATQFLQRPASDDDAIVKRSWWRFHRPAHVPATSMRPAGCDVEMPAVETPASFDRVVIACDMTFGSLKGDYGVAQVWGSKGGARYLLEQWRKKATQLEQQEAIKALARKYPTAKVLVEKAAGGVGAIEQLTAAGVPNIVGVSHGGKGKAERLGLVSPAIEGGHCHLPLGAPWLGDFVEELSGASSHDDAQDACAYALADLATSAPTLPSWVRAFDPGYDARQEARERRNAPCSVCAPVEDIAEARRWIEELRLERLAEQHRAAQRQPDETLADYRARLDREDDERNRARWERERAERPATTAPACSRCRGLAPTEIKEYIDAPYDDEDDQARISA